MPRPLSSSDPFVANACTDVERAKRIARTLRLRGLRGRLLCERVLAAKRFERSTDTPNRDVESGFDAS
jgi:hypothetical protein